MKGDKVNFKLTNKLFYIFVAIIILFAAGTYAITLSNPNHLPDQVYIEYNNTCYFSLANAITYGYLVLPSPSVSSCNAPPFPTDSPYHLASQILINIGPYTMTLQEAYDNSIFVTGSAPNYGASQSYTTILPAGGQLGSQIYINTTSGLTLQNVISNGQISSISNGVPCYPAGTSPSCTNAGTWQNGICTSVTYIARGTACLNDNYACDGSGLCSGTSGTGCNAFTGTVSGSGFSCVNLIDSSGKYWQGTNSGSWSNNNVNVKCQHDCNCDSFGNNCGTCGDTWYIKPGTSISDNSCSYPSSGGSGNNGGQGSGTSTQTGGLTTGSPSTISGAPGDTPGDGTADA